MQNPKLTLTRGKFYTYVGRCKLLINKKASHGSRRIGVLSKDDMVYFIKYHPGNVYRIFVGVGDLFGWVIVPSNYREHVYAFREVKCPAGSSTGSSTG